MKPFALSQLVETMCRNVIFMFVSDRLDITTKWTATVIDHPIPRKTGLSFPFALTFKLNSEEQ